ncbi:MAG: imidazolonepropionase [Bacteroidetes bacterium]|nr:imidazolonepropionase [Bacteroidota bacterium]
MHSKDYLLTNIGELIGILEPGKIQLRGEEMSQVNSIKDAWLLVEDGEIVEFGSMDTCPRLNLDTKDLKGQWVMPAFVDSHTHMVFAGPRHNEYVMRLKGKTYAEIAAEGGGIINSAKKLQVMDEEILFERSMQYAYEAISNGTGALEIKSGYGLSVDAELKMLRVIKRMKENLPITVKATFLGAHAFPPEFRNNHEGYISQIIEQMLPVIAEEGLADFVDVFCDEGFYSPDETDRILKAAISYGLRPKIHGNELGITGGVQVAVANQSLSVDHLEHIGEEEISCLKASSTMPVALPGSSFFLKIPYTPARRIIDSGLPIAIASDFNPGSSPCNNLWFIWSLACLYNGMTPEEGFNALTINAAKAMGLEDTHGSITIGKKACLIIGGPFEHINEMPYWFTKNHAQKVLNSK